MAQFAHIPPNPCLPKVGSWKELLSRSLEGRAGEQGVNATVFTRNYPHAPKLGIDRSLHIRDTGRVVVAEPKGFY